VHKHELIILEVRKVKGQGHDQTRYGPERRRPTHRLVAVEFYVIYTLIFISFRLRLGVTP